MTNQFLNLFSPGRVSIALYTLLHTCSKSNTLSMGEWLRCINVSFAFALSTPRTSRSPTRTARRSSAPSWKASMLSVILCKEPSWVWREMSVWCSWIFNGFNTQPNRAFSKARSVGYMTEKGKCTLKSEIIFLNRISVDGYFSLFLVSLCNLQCLLALYGLNWNWNVGCNFLQPRYVSHRVSCLNVHKNIIFHIFDMVAAPLFPVGQYHSV